MRVRYPSGDHSTAGCLPAHFDDKNASVILGQSPFGIGLFAARDIPRTETILCFGGTVVDSAQVKLRGAAESYALQVGPNRYIDLESPGRYCNHSCEPNAGIRDDVALIAISNIARGTEILYDYSTTMDNDPWVMDCQCGSARCRRLIGEFRHLPRTVRELYLELGIVQRFIAEQYLDYPYSTEVSVRRSA